MEGFSMRGTPVITDMQVIPVAGYDSMLMTLSGAHAPFFTRNIVILKDSSGSTGLGRPTAVMILQRPWRALKVMLSARKSAITGQL